VQPPGVLATWIARATVVPSGRDAPRSRRGRKKLALCRFAAEGGPRANLFRRSALTVATAGTPATVPDR
jgi:hypothetical protein